MVPQISAAHCQLITAANDVERTAAESRLEQIKDAGISLAHMPGFELDYRTGEYIVSDFGFFYRKKVLNCQIPEKEMIHFLIPSYDMNNNLQFFQIAWDKRLTGKNIHVISQNGEEQIRDFPKYSLFSTPRKNGGGRANALPGYVGPFRSANGEIIPYLGSQTTIPVVEGTLKSNLYYFFNEKKEACISQVGVSSFRTLEKFLTEFLKKCPQITQIDDCYDMDKLTNPDVVKGSNRLKEICNKLSVNYHLRLWDPSCKGIDDFYYQYHCRYDKLFNNGR